MGLPTSGNIQVAKGGESNRGRHACQRMCVAELSTRESVDQSRRSSDGAVPSLGDAESSARLTALDSDGSSNRAKQLSLRMGFVGEVGPLKAGLGSV